MPTRKKSSAGRLEDARARMYHDLIFESAEFVFGAHGFESATMQQIAQEAGVSLKTLYATFPGKQELYEEIQRTRGMGLVERVAERLRSGGGPLDRVRIIARTNVEYLFEHPDWFRMHLQDRVPWGLEPKSKDGALYWQQGYGSIVETLRDGIEQGVFFDEDPWSLAMMMQSLVQVQLARAVERQELDVECVVEEVERPLLRLICIDPPTEVRASA